MNIKILDSGWYSTSRTGTQEVVANRAGYDGTSAVTAFDLKVTKIILSKSAHVDDNVVPGSSSYTELNFVTFDNPKYSLDCIVAKDDATAGFGESMIYQLNRLDQTKGVKLLYPSAVTDTYKSLVEEMGAANKAGVFQGSGKELAASTPYLQGRILSINITDTADKKYWDIKIVFQAE